MDDLIVGGSDVLTKSYGWEKGLHAIFDALALSWSAKNGQYSRVLEWRIANVISILDQDTSGMG